ncbi:MAG: tetratricopeptide repeat protein [Gammaproteobacteria bacterium]|nr:tetratricopeptide repeat protein [Gammaproteobacteria bacterium]
MRPLLRRAVVMGSISILMAACASSPPATSQADLTLKSLDEQPTVVLREVASSDLQLAQDSYRAYAAITADQARREYALRRIADLQLAIGEEALASGRPHRQAFADAVVAFQELLRQYPDHARADEVHYQIARAWDNAGDEARSLAALKHVTDRYPDSPLYAESQFRRGEILFARRDYAAAQTAYTAVLAANDGGVFQDQARYKRGWSFYLRGAVPEALADFMAVLARSLVSGSEFRTHLALESLPRTQRELVDDTLRVISLGFARQGGANAVTAWFERHGGAPFEPLVYSRLAEHYLAERQYEQAADTLHAFVARHPLHEQAPLFQIRVAEIYDRAGEDARADSARNEFIAGYGRESAYWEQRDLARMPLVSQKLRDEFLTQAQRSHAEAQRSGLQADYLTAARWYRDYLAFFPDDGRAPELSFLLGELLFESGRYAEAVEHYEQSAYRYSPHPKAADAGYAALVSYQRMLEETAEGEARQLLLARSIDAAVRFTGQFPRHPEVSTVMTRAAQHLFAAGQHSRALTMALRITGGSSAAPELRRTAWVVAGDVQFERAEYGLAETSYTSALEIAEDPQLRERLAVAIYRQGEAARELGSRGEARQHFLRAAAAAPRSAIAETAEYDALAITLTLRDWPAARDQLERFRMAWPESRLQKDVTRELALVYLELGEHARAAEEFGRMAASTDDEEEARAALWRSAELYDQVGDMTRASLAWQRYITLYPEPVDRAIEARLRIAKAFQSRGDVESRRQWLGEVVSAFESDGGSAGSDFSRQAAAQAALELAAPARERFERLRLVAPLDRSLRQKRAAMEAALEAYGRAARFGIPEVATAATYHIGEIYHGFGRALLESERPADLSEDELEEYDVLLEEQAYPFEEEAIKLHEVNFRRIPQGFYDRWVRASMEQLATLMPVRYGKMEKKVEIVETLH